MCATARVQLEMAVEMKVVNKRPFTDVPSSGGLHVRRSGSSYLWCEAGGTCSVSLEREARAVNTRASLRDWERRKRCAASGALGFAGNGVNGRPKPALVLGSGRVARLSPCDKDV